jgi:hypothetical protein
MGDKPAAYIGSKEEPVILLAKRTPALRDEIFIQVMKQLTGNPSPESVLCGWKLLKKLCQAVTPSEDLCDFLRYFLQRAMKMDKAAKAAFEPDSPTTARKFTPAIRRTDTSRASADLDSIDDPPLCMGRTFSLPVTRKLDASETNSAQVPKLAAEAHRILTESTVTKAPAKIETSTKLMCDVILENGVGTQLKYSSGSTLQEMHVKMVKAIGLRDDTRMEFFCSGSR